MYLLHSDSLKDSLYLLDFFLVYAPSLDYFEDSEFLTILQIKKIAITFFIQLQEKIK